MLPELPARVIESQLPIQHSSLEVLIVSVTGYVQALSSLRLASASLNAFSRLLFTMPATPAECRVRIILPQVAYDENLTTFII